MSPPGLIFLPAAVLTFCGIVAGAGCAHDAEEKQLDSMRAEMDKTREDRDKMDKPASHATSAGPELVVPEAYGSQPQGRPPPPAVVQLGDNGAAVDDGSEADPQDTAPRPSIRVFGSARGTGRNAHMEDQVEESAPDDRGNAPAPNSLAPEAKKTYDAAMSLVNAKRYDQALDALAAFLVKWPDHPYADNAMYWRGECYFARGDFAKAADQFEGVTKRFPTGDKVPDALLGLCMSEDKLGQAARAKDCFDRLAQQYPDSDAAHHVPSLRAPSNPPQGPGPQEHR